MDANPLIGVFYHWLGGLSSASFYVPYRGIKRWNWEIFWLTGGIFSWVVMPWLMGSILVPDLFGIMAEIPLRIVGLCVLFGVMWGFGGLTYGLTMRYLGLSLGMAVVLGLCTVFGTLIPPLVQGDFAAKLLDTLSGRIVLLGLGITVLGICVVALAGAAKDRAQSAEEKAATVAEFDFRKGIFVAIFSGIMSACFAFGLAAGEPVKAIAAAHGAGPLWTGLPVLCLVMFGGLLTNGVWCLILTRRNGSAGQWLGQGEAQTAPLAFNYALAILGGSLWYFQFFFYTMGESNMGRYGFSSWVLHMASIIIFGTLWGFALKEWKGASAGVKATVVGGIVILLAATVTIGYGNRLGG